MTPHHPRSRAGITLTEILISILIMGIGLVSLATLFPLGLLRLRDAQRSSRSAFLYESAAADLEARGLLSKSTFLSPVYSPWYFPGYVPTSYDPWVVDTPSFQGNPVNGVRRISGTLTGGPPTAEDGLPVAYDPLWWFVTGFTPNTPGAPEGRFGSGIGFLRDDPNPNGAVTTPSAWGLQRLTNLAMLPNASQVIPDTFVSPEDIILQAEAGKQNESGLSPIVPLLDPSGTSPTYSTDWRFTWMFTGFQNDGASGQSFHGNIVIFENRPFGADTVATPFAFGGSSSLPVPTGETVVEGVFGFSKTVTPSALNASYGIGTAANRIVLLRWPVKVADPDIRVGSWIADVTYERVAAVESARTLAGDVPMQRCHWYRVTKKSAPFPHSFSNDPGVSFRAMTVWVDPPLEAQTLLNAATGEPVHVNAALVCPYVVRVFPATITVR